MAPFILLLNLFPFNSFTVFLPPVVVLMTFSEDTGHQLSVVFQSLSQELFIEDTLDRFL